MAALGRPICGLTRDNSMIVTLPGSPKGSKENLEALLPVLPHALKLALGASSRSLHVNGAPEANQESSSNACGHSHSHQEPKSRSHKTHDPSKGGTYTLPLWKQAHCVQPLLEIARLPIRSSQCQKR